MSSLRQVALDIETTGLTVDDRLTVLGLAMPDGVRVFCQTDGRVLTGLQDSLQNSCPYHISCSTHTTERALLAAVAEFTERHLQGRDLLLVGYNGDVWDGGFDLPFLRTRLARVDRPWPFRDLPYADLFPLVTTRFNTTCGGDSQSDLETVYEILCEGSAGDVDPFTDSAQAVTAFEDGRLGEVIRHNVADLVRTQQLGAVAERYCAKTEFDLKSLTPTNG